MFGDYPDTNPNERHEETLRQLGFTRMFRENFTSVWKKDQRTVLLTHLGEWKEFVE